MSRKRSYEGVFSLPGFEFEVRQGLTIRVQRDFANTIRDLFDPNFHCPHKRCVGPVTCPEHLVKCF